jgi:uncharacterized protein
MSRIFWDTMLFIYLIDDHPEFSERVNYLLQRSLEREDEIFTSHLAMGEVLAGAAKSRFPEKTRKIRETMIEAGFQFLPFVERSVAPFAHLRSVHRVKPADAMNLACAAAAGIDLFLTGDERLLKVHVAGVNFIGDFETAPL